MKRFAVNAVFQKQEYGVSKICSILAIEYGHSQEEAEGIIIKEGLEKHKGYALLTSGSIEIVNVEVVPEG